MTGKCIRHSDMIIIIILIIIILIIIIFSDVKLSIRIVCCVSL